MIKGAWIVYNADGTEDHRFDLGLYTQEEIDGFIAEGTYSIGSMTCLFVVIDEQEPPE